MPDHAEHPQVPPGKAMGCLPRGTRPGEICPLFSERLDVLTDEELREAAGKIDLRQFVSQVLDQDGVRSCATEATAGAAMICRAFGGEEFELLNPWFIYHTTSGGRDRGSNIDSNLAFAREKGIAPESVWPRSKGWRTRPSEEAYAAARKYRIEEFYDITSVREAMSANALGFPVVYGARGHAVVKLNLLPDGESIDLNSWGEKWEQDGFGVWAGYNGINWAYGAWAVRTMVE